MLRIHQMSDLHLEFNNKFRPVNKGNADILMLNGDICVADYFTRGEQSHKKVTADHFRDFFKVASDSYQLVLYVPGNHEHYHGTYIETCDILKEHIPHNNVVIMNDSYIRFNQYKIIGGTLWTDCDKGNPLVLNYLSGYMNDFKIVNYRKEPWKRFTPIDSVIAHKHTLKYLEQECEGEDNVIIMTHHAPSEQSIHGSYRDNMYYYGNRGYFSPLDLFIMDRPQIKLWTHGHMHNNFDYTIGDTRIICNPMGYGTENIHDFNRDQYIDLP